METPKHLRTAEAKAKTDASVIEYVPYGGQDKIKLSIDIVKNLIATKTKQGHPCSTRDALRFIAMCQAKRLNPFEGDAYLVGYDDSKLGPVFSLITAHQAFLKRAELHPEFDGFKSGVIILSEGVVSEIEGDFHLTDQQLVGGWATVFFKTRKYPMVKKARLDRFSKDSRFWNDNPEGQIVKCMEADALRSAFPTMCGGLYLREEINLLPEITGAHQIEAGDMRQLPEGQSDDADYLPEGETREPETVPAKGSEAARNVKESLPGKLKSASELLPVAEQFQAFLTSINCPFEKFRQWGFETGNLGDDGGEITSLNDIPAKVLQRLLNAKAGLTTALKGN